MKISGILLLGLSTFAAAESCKYTSEKHGVVHGTCGKPSSCPGKLGYIVKNLCSGGSQNVCCLEKSCVVPSGRHKGELGSCTETSTCENLGREFRRVANLCPGDKSVQCCYYNGNAI
ncbi:hypothetical protein B0T14DRAFT_586271 [Immersiella caudata]|uniref:Uncharacterized protein n=1 Tax=Immersiella caudata TaxID=314043 RepID=A0AA40C0K6_9PEZI|nr:hypothetical protein B0T14DRAFT_586271 [Immersiella caudata]